MTRPWNPDQRRRGDSPAERRARRRGSWPAQAEGNVVPLRRRSSAPLRRKRKLDIASIRLVSLAVVAALVVAGTAFPDRVMVDGAALSQPGRVADRVAAPGGVAGTSFLDRTPGERATPFGPGIAAEAAAAPRGAFTACRWGGGRDCVVDGDTFFLDGEKIRIAGIDAPETHDYGCAEELALGERAAARLQDLLNDGALTLSPIDRDRDQYGRLLRNAAIDGRDVGETLIAEGLARAYGDGRRPWC